MLNDRLRAVCFDVGGVLVRMPRGPLAEELSELLDCDVQRVRRLLIDHGKCRRTDTTTLASVLATRCGSARRRQIEDMIRHRVSDIAEPQLFPDTLPALQQLAERGWRICLLTNAIGIPDQRPQPIYYAFAEVAVHSWEIGHAKPDPAAFRAVEQRMGLLPEQIVKVGDSATFDITGAAQAGWPTVHLARAGAAATSADHAITTLAELPGLLGTPSFDQLPEAVCGEVA